MGSFGFSARGSSLQTHGQKVSPHQSIVRYPLSLSLSLLSDFRSRRRPRCAACRIRTLWILFAMTDFNFCPSFFLLIVPTVAEIGLRGTTQRREILTNTPSTLALSSSNSPALIIIIIHIMHVISYSQFALKLAVLLICLCFARKVY